MKIKIERCWGNSIRATVLTGAHKGVRETFNIDLDVYSRRTAVGFIRDLFERQYGANRSSIKSEWWN